MVVYFDLYFGVTPLLMGFLTYTILLNLNSGFVLLLIVTTAETTLSLFLESTVCVRLCGDPSLKELILTY